MLRRLVIPVLAGSLAATPAHAIDAMAWTADVGVGYDDNLGNSASSDDVRDAAILSVGGGGSWEHRFGRYTALALSGGVAAEQVSDVEELSNTRATARVRLRHKPGRSFYVPVLAVWASLGGRDYGSAIRDSYDYRAAVSLTEPLTTAIQLRAEAGASKRDSKGRVYDLDGAFASVNVDWRVGSRATLYASYGIDDSPVVVSAAGHGDIQPKTQHLYLETYADAIQKDEAFGGSWWAFRVDGHSTIVAAGVNVPLSSMMALDLQVRQGQAKVRSYEYERLLGGVSLLLRW